MIEPRYLTVEQCAIYLGRTVDGVRGLVKRRQVPVIRLGRKVQFDKEALDRWIQRHSQRGATI